MSYTKQQLWERFLKFYADYPELGLAVDISRMNFSENFWDSMVPMMRKGFAAMAELERGAIANADEQRMVGHYWLRNPALAPTHEIRTAIESTLAQINAFAAAVHEERIKGAGGRFTHVLLIGIGGSALGPQFVSQALGHPASDRMRVHFFDNTDPDGFDRVLSYIGGELGRTLCVVVSKSGGTKETRNGMLEAQKAYTDAKLNFPEHAVAVTSDNSELSKLAKSEGWLRIFPMWDWVGGRTSELSAVGLLPAALQGLDIDAMLAGAKACDEVTRLPSIERNPAARLASMWHYAGNGKGDKNMVILPYKDRLELFSRYLQQLVMESLGKQLDRDGKAVHQGMSVFGNKGSTDQHAYVQQLRDGRNDFFVTFIEVLRDRQENSMDVEPGVTSGDYLSGFFQGTRTALYENGRESITLTICELTPFSVGVLIALFERTVGFYAALINVNAYHQPGVEAGKKAATAVVQLQTKVMKLLASECSKFTVYEIAQRIGAPEEVETVFKICEHLAANPTRKIVRITSGDPFQARYGVE